MSPFKRILVPTDFGESSQRALDLAVVLARTFDASLTLVHAYDVPSYVYSGMTFTTVDLLKPIEEAAQRQVEDALVALRKQVPGAKGGLRHGEPWREILAAIEDTGADLVVMGTHGRRGLSHAILGSVAEKTVRMSLVPVLTVRDAPATVKT
jgi:nucleotide-binding universal stress UspA family protein